MEISACPGWARFLRNVVLKEQGGGRLSLVWPPGGLVLGPDVLVLRLYRVCLAEVQVE